MKQAIGIQLPFLLKIKLEKYIFLAANACFLDPCWNGNVHTYAMTKQLQIKAFTTNSQNMN